jgi:antitoxin component YwqK of YwqJK toxin-antitoxin module
MDHNNPLSILTSIFMNKLNFIITIFLIFFSSILFSQNKNFDPNNLKPEYFKDASIKDNAEFNDKEGHTYKIKNSASSIGLYIKKDNSWVKHGVWHEYYEGNLASKAIYSYGKLHGRKDTYRSNGKVQFSYEYVNGVQEGKSYQYWETGSLYEECPYVNGKKDGLKITYRENGTIQFKTNFKEGQRHGDHYQYDDKGTQVAHEQYNMGKKI